MNTNALEKFAQSARRKLLEQVSARLEQVLKMDTAEFRGRAAAIHDLEKEIADSSKNEVSEKVAYTWFNRFCALRFMDANRYLPMGAITPLPGHTEPEIFEEAKNGLFMPELKGILNQQKVLDLLDGVEPSSNPQQEAYRMLVVAVCNWLHQKMPFLFEKIQDYTELLMPLDLLSENAVLYSVREALTDEACQDVEVIGWLYQFYISEKKDQVMGAKGKVAKEDIPAVTQLFTPHWIVRYLVENSLGRLWMLNNPQSTLVEKMDYYISPDDQEINEDTFIRISSPEELRICDPACGSGHMLVYAFELLQHIYTEEGYDPREITGLILTKNLYGIEIDQRAGTLAAFALCMKARGYDRQFLEERTQPNICVMEDVHFRTDEINAYMDQIGEDLYTQELWQGLKQFEDAENLGSLIQPAIKNPDLIRERMEQTGVFNNLLLGNTNQKLLKVLEMSEYLQQRYHVVVANPPYMSSRSMNKDLKSFAKAQFPDVKSDLFSMFIKRNCTLAKPGGDLGFMSPFVWMFISSYKKLRQYLIDKKTISSLVQLEYGGFSGAVVPICTFTIINRHLAEFEGAYIRLSDFRGPQNQAPKTLEAIKNHDCGWFYRASAIDFKKIPGSPIAYWVSEKIIEIFTKGEILDKYGDAKQGLATADNSRFLRLWHEVSLDNCNFGCSSRKNAKLSGKRWFPYNKGGSFRRWYGNQEYLINWKNDGKEIRDFDGSVIRNSEFYFNESGSWSKVTSGQFCLRYFPKGFLFDVAGCSIFAKKKEFLLSLIGAMNSPVMDNTISAISPTLNYEVGQISAFPVLPKLLEGLGQEKVEVLISISKEDWDSFETSWNFATNELVEKSQELKLESLARIYQVVFRQWQDKIKFMKELEEENNLIFTKTYGIKNEIDYHVPLEKISINHNPHYRYNSKKSFEELQVLLKSDAIKELISFANGCIFGRFSLDKPGLILANQGDTLGNYLTQIPEPTYTPDKDNVIPVVEGDWFPDGAASRFKDFLRVTFGDENFSENLNFIEEAIGRSIEDYFLKDFIDDHIQMYQKRPIYWLFSSPKGSFNALIYLHRYTPETISIILNNYLRPFQRKLAAEKQKQDAISIDETLTARERTRALKESERLSGVLDELETYERKTIMPLAAKRLEIDLDDGVAVNYPKFGDALYHVRGLSD